MKIQHFERFDGRVTTAQYTDERGTPTASSFTGWLSKQQVEQRLIQLRAAWDRAKSA